MKYGSTLARFALAATLVAAMLFGTSRSWAKGPLDGEAATFITQNVSKILIRENLCSSVQDCIEHKYVLYTSWESIAFNVYGIADEKVIKEIFLAMLNSSLRVSHFRVWRSKHDDKSFLEKPILEFTDHTGGK